MNLNKFPKWKSLKKEYNISTERSLCLNNFADMYVGYWWDYEMFKFGTAKDLPEFALDNCKQFKIILEGLLPKNEMKYLNKMILLEKKKRGYPNSKIPKPIVRGLKKSEMMNDADYERFSRIMIAVGLGLGQCALVKKIINNVFRYKDDGKKPPKKRSTKK